MSSVMEIEKAISGLPKEDFWKLAEWFDHVRSTNWENQMADDAENGALDFLFEEASASRQSDTMKPWPSEE